MTTTPNGPLDAMPDLPPEPPQWPKVIGIVSIVWGILGGACGGCGMTMLFVMPMMLPPEMTKGGLPPTMTPTPTMLAGQGMGLLMAVLLIIAGAATLKRTIQGRTLHMVYACLSFVTVAIALWMNWKNSVDMKTWIANNPDNPMAKQQAQTGDLSFFIGTGAILVFGLVYPIFLLVWFGLIKRTEESMRESAAA